MIEVLQTIGICIGSIALVFIAVFLFFISMRLEILLNPFAIFQDEELDVIDVDEEPVAKSSKRMGRKYGKEKK